MLMPKRFKWRKQMRGRMLAKHYVDRSQFRRLWPSKPWNPGWNSCSPKSETCPRAKLCRFQMERTPAKSKESVSFPGLTLPQPRQPGSRHWEREKAPVKNNWVPFVKPGAEISLEIRPVFPDRPLANEASLELAPSYKLSGLGRRNCFLR